MKRATLACLATLGLLGGLALCAPTAGHAQQPAPPAAQAPAASAAAPPTAVGRSGTSVGRSDRRRRSYAACNRASHQRDLRGGKRRRFLIRCRLGYERPRQAQPAPGQGSPPAPAAPAPGARP